MTSFKVIYHRNAQKFINKNKKEGLRFYKVFLEIAEDRNNFIKYDIKKLVNKSNSYRL